MQSAAPPMMVGREMSVNQMAGGGPMHSQQQLAAYRRASPYPNPQQVMMQRKSQYGPNMTANAVSTM